MATKTDLQKAYAALSAKQPQVAGLWAYYDGDHPLEYSTERLRKVFKAIKTKFIENWCGVVVDSVLERLDLTTIAVANDDAATKTLETLWTETELELDEEDTHRAALVTGEGFIVAWPDEDGKPEAYYNEPALMHVEYDPEDRRTKLWAVKWWVDPEGYWRLTMWYPDRLLYYITRTTRKPRNSKAFVPMEVPESENSTDTVPVFHFRRKRRTISSELKNVIPLQAAINKLLADMMVSAEFGAYLQRYIISNTAEDLSKTLKNLPGSVWDIPTGTGEGQATSVGHFPATSLQNFLDAIDDLVSAVSAISRTPHHYFFGKGAVPSGEALIALEAPLNHKARTYIKSFSSVWRQVAAFLLLLKTGKEVDPSSIAVTFAKPETVQPKTEAEIRQLSADDKLPLVTALRREGWTQEELDQLEKDQADEQARKQTSLALAMMEAQRRFAQGEGEEPGETEGETDGETEGEGSGEVP